MVVSRLHGHVAARTQGRNDPDPDPDPDTWRISMNRLEWNELQVGDRVLVHDDGDARAPLLPGRVTAVEVAPGSNDVAIRIPGSRGKSQIVHPPRLSVHLEELDPDARCWRCEARVDDFTKPRPKAPAR